MGIPQIDPNLSNPIDEDAPPTIYGSHLKPELATAALNLPIDFIKQKESLANHYLATHHVTISAVLIAASVYVGKNYVFTTRSTNSVAEYLSFFLSNNKKEIITTVIVLCISASLLITSLSRLTGVVFKPKIDSIVNSRGITLFGLDLKQLANGDSKSVNDKKVDDTYVVVYRETPIALVSIAENMQLSTKESLVMGITTIGCRQVYQRSGIIEDLLDWALLRTKDIQQQSGKYKPGQSMKLLIEVYSFDKFMKKTLKKKGFNMLESFSMPESKILGGLFRVRRELWGIKFHFESKKE
ncbi:HBR208Cp [Eremothecium sinecaudum]|uniref:HBR208Cp n=1 Tax=Eremothecium sinecaudum TaxID=45286 RepID=A0A120K179_9SACH|nr:HBR208Cp [Eremothecium sinecaudum]AMD19109.1 HBR208Cp [Eremothecium sinecaudum]